MRHPLLFLALLISTGCSDRTPATETVSDAPWRQPGDVIDSIFPMDEQFRRFRADIPEVTELSGGEASREALIQRFIAAVEQRDTATVAALQVTQAEFAWLYAPSHQFSAPPYDLPPALFWFQIEQGSAKGAGRVLERLGGRPLNYKGYACPSAEATPIGRGTVHAACVVTVDDLDGVSKQRRLFSGIFELGGRFKFVSYANEF